MVIAGDPRNQYITVTGCVPPSRIENPSAYFTGAAINSKVFVIYFHHEHC